MRKTSSVCPVCLRQIPAVRVKEDGAYYLRKTCPEHGDFSTILWRGSEDPALWAGTMPESGAQPGLTCPEDCGLCSNHLRGTCCTLLEITDRCNLNCTFCFADPHAKADPSLDEVKGWIDEILRQTGGTLLQFSGGEPTVRDDLPEIVAYAKEAGCTYIQLNTNGLRLAEDPDYVKALAQAGLSFAFLQFDGVDDDVYRSLRGRPMLEIKKQAIEACSQNRIGVTLVPTLVPGVNTHQVGDIIRFGMDHSPAVRGIHFQPVSYFGRMPYLPRDDQRYTMGELLDNIVEQTGGLVERESLIPSSCDHPLCGLHGDYIVMPHGRLANLSRRGMRSACSSSEVDPAVQNREYIGRRWSRLDEPEPQMADQPSPASSGPSAPVSMDGASCCCCDVGGYCAQPEEPAVEEADVFSLDGFLRRKRTHGFTLTSMAFQDAGNLDIERLRQCSLHVFRDGKRIPFCAAYLSRFEL